MQTRTEISLRSYGSLYMYPSCGGLKQRRELYKHTRHARSVQALKGPVAWPLHACEQYMAVKRYMVLRLRGAFTQRGGWNIAMMSVGHRLCHCQTNCEAAVAGIRYSNPTFQV